MVAAMRSSLFLALFAVACGGGTTSTTPDPIPNADNGTDGATPPTPRLALGSTTTGSIDPSDTLDGDGRYFDRYELDLEAGTRVRIRVPATSIDPMLRIEGADGFTRFIDDVLPHTLDAMLELSVPTTGTYTLTVTTAPFGQTGPYSLTVVAHPVAGDAYEVGGMASYVIGRSGIDADYPGHTFLRFHADGGSILRLRVTSRDFDTIATVIGPAGDMWVNDDANDLGEDGSERALDSTVEMSVPETGDYQLVVSSYGHPGAGAFAVRTSVRPPVVYRAGETVPSGDFAGPEGRGRILGVYAGITAYGAMSQLYGCADDARLLGEAMRASHLQRVDEQVVLTDGAATRDAFLSGIRDVARRARPDDVVMVFWSGHGNVQPTTPTSLGELDGLDETIVLYDGSLTDDEVVHEMDAIATGATVILALDSCHSGGFAEDFVVRPGRMGIFSSDEDVLSDTAEPRRAGGYLSWYLRRGVLGEGDYKPHDGVLHAGELTDYMVDGFVTDHRLMNPDGALDPSQRLDFRRGSVGWTDVLWVYPRGEDLALPELPAITLESPSP